jgi:hypothetical protein
MVAEVIRQIPHARCAKLIVIADQSDEFGQKNLSLDRNCWARSRARADRSLLWPRAEEFAVALDQGLSFKLRERPTVFVPLGLPHLTHEIRAGVLNEHPALPIAQPSMYSWRRVPHISGMLPVRNQTWH